MSRDNLTTTRNIILITEEAQVAERAHTAYYLNGAAIRGSVMRAVGVHYIRIRVERMFMNRELFIGIQGYLDTSLCSSHPFDNIDTSGCGTVRASGWFGNNSIAIFGKRYSSSNPTSTYLTGTYEQFYTTNDIVLLTINCEDATLTLKNERTEKEYRMSVDHGQNHYGKLPWMLHVNLFYPGDKVRLLPS